MGEKEPAIVSQGSDQPSSLSAYQVLLIGVLGCMLFTIVVDYMTLPALSAILLPALGMTTQAFGVVVSAYAFSAGISALLATGFADRIDRKKLLGVYYGGFLGGILLCATADSLLTLIAARVVTGTFGGVVAAICLAIVADVFQPGQRGRVMGYIHMAFAGGLVAGLPLAMYLATRFHWHLTYGVLFAIGLAIGGVFFFKVRPIDAHLYTAPPDSLLKHAAHVVQNGKYWTVFAHNIFLVLGDAMFMTFASAYSTYNLGVSLDDLPLIYGIGGGATIVCSPVIGKLSDRYGTFRIFALGTAMAIVLVAIYSHLGRVPLWVVVVVNALFMVGINARMIASTALATVVPAPQDRGAFMALDSSLQQVAGGVAATAAGWIVYQAPDGMISGYPSLGWTVIGMMCVTIALMYAIYLMVNRNRQA